MLKLRRISASHRDAFLERYEGLLGWALQMTANDRALAEDLLHDLFILFTLSAPELGRIQNLDNYLYTSLRNLHISQLRRTTRGRFEQLEMVEYESARLSLRSIAHGRDLIQAQDELRRICHYACARKATANSASVLILRFFHGYYPSEIARVMRSTRNAVDVRLRAARIEAKAYLENSGSLAIIDGSTEPVSPKVFPARFARTAGDFLLELQQTVFDSRQGDCLDREGLKHLYEAGHQGPIARKHLAHIVSCPVCLDTVNSLLGLPLLAERYPTDTMDKDNKKGGGPPEDGAQSDKRGGAVRRLDEWEREAREAFEHKPQELCVSVNGYLLGSQLIGSELSELTLNVAADERISFCEVFSEQGIRLMMVNVDELPPNGPGELRQRVSLSESRTLESALLFSNPFPTLHVTYHDPALAVEAAVDGEVTEAGDIVTSQTPQQKRINRLRLSSPIKKLDKPISSFVKALRERFLNLHFWLKPATITAMIAVGLIAAVILLELRQPAPPLTAADLLQRSTQAEEAIAAMPDTVLHRTLQLEERSSSGDLIARRRIESWQSGERGVIARRLYNEKNDLIAGDWRRSDGVQTLYHHGSQPRLQMRGSQSAIRSFEDVWQLDSSAKEFISLIGDASRARVEESSNTYVISVSTKSSSDRVVAPSRSDDVKVAQGFSPGIAATNANGPRRGDRGDSSATLVKATLVLSKSDLHPIEQTLVVRQANEIREYKFTEIEFEQKTASSVSPTVFDPEPELLSSTKLETPNSKLETTSLSPLALTPSPVVATPELEVEVLGLLHRAGADLGEQVIVIRTREGQLRVEGLVDTEQRKAQLVRALESVRSNPAVRIEISTVAEAVKRQSAAKSSPESIVVERQEVARSITADSDLRRYFSAKGVTADQVDQEVTRLTNRIVNRSVQVMTHAWAIKRLAERFTPEQLNALAPDARAKWLAIVRPHAHSVRQETASLRLELQPVFPSAASAAGGDEKIEISNDADLLRAIERLFEVCAANDRMVSSAFAIKSQTTNVSDLQGSQFWRSLRRAENLAAKISGQ